MKFIKSKVAILKKFIRNFKFKYKTYPSKKFENV